MGVVIAGIGISLPSGPTTHGARRLADAAAKRCLEDATAPAHDVHLLVNAGIYRERGLGEPALAALIQEDVDANPTPNAETSGTFSFDIDNGACGFLTGADIARGFLESHTVDGAMVVASDSAPGPLQVRGFPYTEAGGAAMLRLTTDDRGFVATRFETFPEYAGLNESAWEWRPHRALATVASTGHNRLAVVERPGFRSRAVDCATDVVKALLHDQQVTPDGVDLLIGTPEPGFADELALALGIPTTRVVHLGEKLGRTHTAQPIAAIDVARRTGYWTEARTVLFVSAGSGITIGAALYRN